VVAERLGYPTDAALTLGRFVAGSSTRAKARRLGIIEEKQEAEEQRVRAAELKPRRQTVDLLGRDIAVAPADDGTLRAKDDGKPASARSVQTYIARAFGDRPGEARGAMEARGVRKGCLLGCAVPIIVGLSETEATRQPARPC
jgi:hypothetical protein